jgi:hypothetical protein
VSEQEEVPNPTCTTHDASNLLYHDILMHVFTYLDATDLTAFSETARQPNFEVFYFLQLQLQRALLGNAVSATNDDDLSAIAGVASIHRLAALDRTQADATVQTFLDSNSTLRTMPLSHSLAYIRQMLRLSHQHQHPAPQQALASAALLITFVGAASFMSAAPETVVAEMASFGTELPNMLLKVGFVGSLFGAARKMSDPIQQQEHVEQGGLSAMRCRAEIFARNMQQLLPKMTEVDEPTAGFSLGRMMQVAYQATYGDTAAVSPSTADDRLSTPNPYEHLPNFGETKNGELHEESQTHATATASATAPVADLKIPSGCVGAYTRSVARANVRIADTVKEQRKARFLALSIAEQQQISSDLIDACCSDESFAVVQEWIQVRGAVDVEGFYMGSDGTETCALHAAAFHGSCKILDLLCNGIDESDPTRDGGLCAIELIDSNGWTAMHFAAGANSPEAVRILAKHGASLSVEAANGYTPLQWAVRLQNESVAEELRVRIGTERQLGWISRQPLSAIASRFFALIPSH